MTQRRQPVRENMLLALDTLRTHKFRAFLTILGVLIGTATVIGVASIFKGLDQQVVEMMEGLRHSDPVHLQVRSRDPTGNLTHEEAIRKPLTYEDAMAIRDMCPSVETVAVEIFHLGPSVTAKYKGVEMVGRQFLRPYARGVPDDATPN